MNLAGDLARAEGDGEMALEEEPGLSPVPPPAVSVFPVAAFLARTVAVTAVVTVFILVAAAAVPVLAVDDTTFGGLALAPTPAAVLVDTLVSDLLELAPPSEALTAMEDALRLPEGSHEVAFDEDDAVGRVFSPEPAPLPLATPRSVAAGDAVAPVAILVLVAFAVVPVAADEDDALSGLEVAVAVAVVVLDVGDDFGFVVVVVVVIVVVLLATEEVAPEETEEADGVAFFLATVPLPLDDSGMISVVPLPVVSSLAISQSPFCVAAPRFAVGPLHPHA